MIPVMCRLGTFYKGDFNSPPCMLISLVLVLTLHFIGMLVDDHLKVFFNIARLVRRITIMFFACLKILR